MINDRLLQPSVAQAITAAAASTDYIDLGVARDIGAGENLSVVVSVDVAFTDSGSDSTLTVALQYDSTTTFTPDESQTLFTIPALAAAGTFYVARIQPTQTAYRYAQLYYTPNNGNLTTGTVTASIVKDADVQKYYASGFTIS